jgi:hypothetical protein
MQKGMNSRGKSKSAIRYSVSDGHILTDGGPKRVVTGIKFQLFTERLPCRYARGPKPGLLLPNPLHQRDGIGWTRNPPFVSALEAVGISDRIVPDRERRATGAAAPELVLLVIIDAATAVVFYVRKRCCRSTWPPMQPPVRPTLLVLSVLRMTGGPFTQASQASRAERRPQASQGGFLLFFSAATGRDMTSRLNN